MLSGTYKIGDVITSYGRHSVAIAVAQLTIVVIVRLPTLKDQDTVAAEVRAACRDAVDELRVTCARYGWRMEDGDAVLGDFKEVVENGLGGWAAALSWTPRAPEPRLDVKACIDATKDAQQDVLRAIDRARHEMAARRGWRWPWSRR